MRNHNSEKSFLRNLLGIIGGSSLVHKTVNFARQPTKGQLLRVGCALDQMRKPRMPTRGASASITRGRAPTYVRRAATKETAKFARFFAGRPTNLSQYTRKLLKALFDLVESGLQFSALFFGERFRVFVCY